MPGRATIHLLTGLAFLALAAGSLWADDVKKPKSPGTYGSKLEKVDVIPPEWKAISPRKLTPSDVDRLLAQLQAQEGLKPAALTSDEQFIRRVYLDLAGKLPEPDAIKAFVADKSKSKRATLIDQLLQSDDFNRHWARYWRDVVTARATEPRTRLNEPMFETWLANQIKENRSWSDIVREMITTSGELRYGPGEQDKTSDSGAGYFLLTHIGPDAINERAADTARVFLGIQIQCAQCHDHPSDVWKREQFHELAAFFARTKDRPVREENRLVGYKIFSAMIGEHRMPDKDNPQKTYLKDPKFLTGETPRRGLEDQERRTQLAGYVTAEGNYWFFANMVNRLWADLMGQAFYNPVDNMGPLQEAIYPDVLMAVAAHFRASGADIRDLYRLIMNTQAYQRQLRLGETTDQHVHFAGSYPARLTSDELWNALSAVLGGNVQIPLRGSGRTPAQGPAERMVRRFGFEGIFKQLFAYDPTQKQDEVEGSIPQALMLMNNPLIQNRIRASDGVLAGILRTHPSDKDAVGAIYLRILARTPTAREEKIALEYVKKSPKRPDAYEDLFWALLNSAEFQTKR